MAMHYPRVEGNLLGPCRQVENRTAIFIGDIFRIKFFLVKKQLGHHCRIVTKTSPTKDFNILKAFLESAKADNVGW